MKFSSKLTKKVENLFPPPRQMVSTLWLANKGLLIWGLLEIHTHGQTSVTILPTLRNDLTKHSPTLSGEPLFPRPLSITFLPPLLIIIPSFSILLALIPHSLSHFVLRQFGPGMAAAHKSSRMHGIVWSMALHYTSLSKSSKPPKKI